MILKTKKGVVTELVKEWHNSFEIEKKDYHKCYDVFVSKYSKVSGINIYFDNSISSTLVAISKSLDFLQFSDEKDNELKKTL